MAANGDRVSATVGESGDAWMLTREGRSALTPAYAAPEQLTGGHVTTATDNPTRTVADLRGRRVAGGYPAQLAVWFDGLALLTGCGMTWDDVRVVSVQRVTAAGLKGLGPTVRALALAEGLTAHAQSMIVRGV